MIIFKKQTDIRVYLKRLEAIGIGFVPTMGALHEGHLSLIRQAKKENDLVIVSIFINPTQFNNSEDYTKYPIKVESDIKMLTEAKVDILFMPSKEEIYPEEKDLNNDNFDFGTLEQVLEGKMRKNHFKGVAQIVSILLNTVEPHKLYLGQKDYQQYLIIKMLIQQLNKKVTIVLCPIVREAKGLAMSSRNVRLSPKAHLEANNIFKALTYLEEHKSEKLEEVSRKAKEIITQSNIADLEYFEVVDKNTLSPLLSIEKGNTLACIAVKIDGVRLIDNILL